VAFIVYWIYGQDEDVVDDANPDIAFVPPAASVSKPVESEEPELETSPSRIEQVLPEASEPGFNETIRERWDSSPELPDGIAFFLNLILISVMNQHGPNAPRDWLQSELNISAEDAEILSARLQELSSQLNSDVLSEQHNLLCSGEVAKVYDDEVFDVFEHFDVYRDALSEEYYLSLMSEATPEMAEKLADWVDRRKLSTTTIRFDYRKRYESKGTDVNAKAAEMCLGLHTAVVEMYDPLGHFVYFESHGGFSYESGRKRNTTQATSSRARS